jgi:WD40 repeat protein
LAFSPDGKLFAGVIANPGPPARVCLWTMSDKAPKVIGPAVERVRDIAFSPDGDLLAWSDDKLVRLFDVRDGKELKTFKNEAPSSRLAFTAEGRHLVNGGVLHPLTAKAAVLKLPRRTDRLAFSRNGRVAVAVAEDGFTMVVFDVKKPAR